MNIEHEEFVTYRSEQIRVSHLDDLRCFKRHGGGQVVIEVPKWCQKKTGGKTVHRMTFFTQNDGTKKLDLLCHI